MKKINIAVVLWLMGLPLTTFGQSLIKYPIIGERMPSFELNNVQHFKDSRITEQSLLGKWTILDFWTRYCAACVQSFPKVNELQKEFEDNIQFLLVGRLDEELYKNTDEIYEKYRKRLKLHLAVAFDDEIFNQFGIQAVPHIVIIDPRGFVYAVTNPSFLTSENLSKMVNGEKSEFRTEYNRHQEVPESEKSKPWEYLFDESLREKGVLFQSILAKNKGELNAGFYGIEYSLNKGMFQHACITLEELYKIAYWGITGWNRSMPVYKEMYNDYWPYPIIEAADSNLFHTDYTTRKGFYNYLLVVPREKSSKEYLMATMQNDLLKNFGFQVAMEKRMMPCWKLTVTEKARKTLISKSDSTIYQSGPMLTTEVLAEKSDKRMKLLEIVGSLDKEARPAMFDELFPELRNVLTNGERIALLGIGESTLGRSNR